MLNLDNIDDKYRWQYWNSRYGGYIYAMLTTTQCVQEVQCGKQAALTLCFPAPSLYPNEIYNGHFIHPFTHTLVHQSCIVVGIWPTCRGRSSQVRLANLRPTLPLKSEVRCRGWSRRASPLGTVTGLWPSEPWQMAKGGEALDPRWSPGLQVLTSSDTEYPSSWPHRGPLQKLPFTDTVVHGEWMVPVHLGGGKRVWVRIDVWSPNLTRFFFFFKH